MKQQTQTKKIEWGKIELGEILDYEQPTKYIVEGTDYKDEYKTPVLTAGKSFILGYTNETKGICDNLPVIIFDDFTTDTKFVDFKFKVKSSAMKILRSKNELIDIKFVFLAMQRLKFDAKRHKRYYLSAYQNLKIPMPFFNGKPDIQTQKAIVSILEKAEQLKQKREESDKLTEEYLQSVFYEMFGDPITNNKRLPFDILENVCSNEKNSLKRGPFWGSLKKEIFVKEGYKVYEQQNAIYEDMSLGEYYITKEKYDEMIDFAVKSGDFIISCSGTMGKIAFVPEDSPEGIINQALLKITLDKNIINNIYFRFLFQSNRIQDHLFSISRGSGISNFPPMSEIRNLKIILPPINQQNKFASIVEEVEKLKEKQKQSKEEIKKMFDSLMQKSFNGELVK